MSHRRDGKGRFQSLVQEQINGTVEIHAGDSCTAPSPGFILFILVSELSIVILDHGGISEPARNIGLGFLKAKLESMYSFLIFQLAVHLEARIRHMKNTDRIHEWPHYGWVRVTRVSSVLGWRQESRSRKGVVVFQRGNASLRKRREATLTRPASDS